MKKLYTLILAAATATSVFAFAPTQIDVSKLGEFHPISELTGNDDPVYIDMSNVQEARHLSRVTTPAALRTPAKALAINDAMGDYDFTFSSWSDVATESSATLEYLEEYNIIELSFPEISNLYPFEGTYDAESASLSFKPLNYGQIGTGISLYMIPVSSAKQLITSGSINIPYDESTKSFDFDGKGIAFVQVASTGTINGLYWGGYNFVLKTADEAMKFKLEAGDECTPDNKFSFQVTTGSGIASVKVMLLPDMDVAAAKVTSYFPVLGQTINGNNPYTVTANMDKTGPYCVVAGGYDADGNLVKYASTTFINIVDEADAYQTIGTIEFVDPFISQYYNNANFTNPACEIQEKIAEPGYFRLVNPYAGSKGIHADGCNHYIYLDVRDPEYATIDYSPTGVDYGDGQIVIGTFAALDYSKDEAKENELPMGVLDGRSILLPIKSVLAHESKYNEPGSWSYMNNSAPIELDLPTLTLEVKALDATGAPAEGIAIEVAGQTATTDTEGLATLTLPAEIDYLDTVAVKASKDDASAEKEVKLEGAKNQCDITIDTSAVKNIAADADADAPAEYYNLQGVRIDNPAAGQIIIKRQGGHAAKILVK